MAGSSPVARLVRTFLDSKLTGLLIAASTLFGIGALLATPREENPRITVPTAIVSTDVLGRSRDEIQRLVTLPLERLVGQIANIDHVYTSSSDGNSTITIRYKVGTDTNQAYVDLYTRLLGNRAILPADAAAPVVSRIDIDDVPIAVLTLSSHAASDATLRAAAYRLSDALDPIEGIGTLTLYGGRLPAVNVILDPRKMQGYGVSFGGIETALAAVGERDAGYASDHVTRESIRAGSPFANAADIARATVGVRDGASIALGEIATVTRGYERRESYAWYSKRGDGRDVPAVSVAIAKRSDANAVSVADAVLAASSAVALPAGMQLAVTRNDGAKANDAVNELLQRLIEAIAIVSVLLFFTLGWREAAIVALAIPITLFITLGTGMLLHQSINRITLFALILSLGLLVDDAIVVIENIHRRSATATSDVRTAIVDAVAEVGTPTILATLTVILAFVPMAFVTGLMGPYMRPIPINVPVAMLASLGVAFIVTPWAAKRFLRPKAHGDARPEPWLIRRYRTLLAGLLDNGGRRRAFFTVLVVALLLAFALPVVGMVQFRMLPAQNEKTFVVAIDEPIGTDIERTRAATLAVERALLAEGDVHDVEAFVGRHSVPDFNGVLRGSLFRDAAWYADLRVNLVPPGARRRASEEIVRDLRPRLALAAAPFAASVRLVEEPPGPPVRATILGVVEGPDPLVRARIARALATRLRAEPGVVDVATSEKTQPQRTRVHIDLRRAALSGVTPSVASDEIAAAFGGLAVTTIRDPQARDAIPVVLQYPAEFRTSSSALEHAMIPSTTAAAVSLASIATTTRESTPPALQREDGIDVTYATGEMAGRSSTYAVIDQLIALARSPLTPAGYRIRWDGEWQLTLEVFRDLGAAMGVAIVLIYFVLVARFGSLRTPLVILSAIPLGMLGVLPGFALLAPAGVYFSATAMIGVIALSGIVVRNSIVLIEFVEERVAGGAALRAALIDAGTIRARPIVLTAAAGMLSAIVIAADPVWSGLAWALVFGMGTSAMLSLFVIPLLYAGKAPAVVRVPAPHEALRAETLGV